MLGCINFSFNCQSVSFLQAYLPLELSTSSLLAGTGGNRRQLAATSPLVFSVVRLYYIIFEPTRHKMYSSGNKFVVFCRVATTLQNTTNLFPPLYFVQLSKGQNCIHNRMQKSSLSSNETHLVLFAQELLIFF